MIRQAEFFPGEEDPYNKDYDKLTAFWPRGHLVEGEFRARTRKAILVDENWIPASQIEASEICGDKAKLIVSDWFFKKLMLSLP